MLLATLYSVAIWKGKKGENNLNRTYEKCFRKMGTVPVPPGQHKATLSKFHLRLVDLHLQSIHIINFTPTLRILIILGLLKGGVLSVFMYECRTRALLGLVVPRSCTLVQIPGIQNCGMCLKIMVLNIFECYTYFLATCQLFNLRVHIFKLFFPAFMARSLFSFFF